MGLFIEVGIYVLIILAALISGQQIAARQRALMAEDAALVRTLRKAGKRLNLKAQERSIVGSIKGRKVEVTVKNTRADHLGQDFTRISVSLSAAAAERLDGLTSYHPSDWPAASFPAATQTDVMHFPSLGIRRSLMTAGEVPLDLVRLLTGQGPMQLTLAGKKAHFDAEVALTEVGDLVQRVEDAVRWAGDVDRLVGRLPSLLASIEHQTAASLRLLTIGFADSKESTAAARAHLEATDPELRLIAALHLGKAGIETLRSLATNPGPQALPALRALIEWESARKDPMVANVRDRLVPILKRTLRWGIEDLQVSALKTLCDVAGTEALGTIAVLSRDDRPNVAIACAEELAKLAHPDARAALTDMLNHPNLDVVSRVVDLLAVVGTLEAVEPLVALKEWAEKGLADAAQAAIWCIQDRAGRGEPGQLSLVGAEEEGRLSLAADAAGLVLHDDEDTETPEGGRSTD